jgi:hypothetical protein
MDINLQKLLSIVSGKVGSYRYSPALAGAGASGVTLTAGAGAWGAYADLVAAGAITTPFFATGLAVYTSDAAQVFELQAYNATALQTIGNWLIDVTAVTLNIAPMPIGPFPVFCAGSAQIQGRAGGAAAKTINVALQYALGL